MSTAGFLDLIGQLQTAVVDFLKLADGGDFGAFEPRRSSSTPRPRSSRRSGWVPGGSAHHAVVAEVRCRDLPGAHLACTAQGFLSQLWRITPARGRCPGPRGRPVRPRDHPDR